MGNVVHIGIVGEIAVFIHLGIDRVRDGGVMRAVNGSPGIGNFAVIDDVRIVAGGCIYDGRSAS